MKEKIDVDMDPYRIRGACNPGIAHKAFGVEPGAVLPCYVILRQVGAAVEISAVDPVASMQAIVNDDLTGPRRRDAPHACRGCPSALIALRSAAGP